MRASSHISAVTSKSPFWEGPTGWYRNEDAKKQKVYSSYSSSAVCPYSLILRRLWGSWALAYERDRAHKFINTHFVDSSNRNTGHEAITSIADVCCPMERIGYLSSFL